MLSSATVFCASESRWTVGSPASAILLVRVAADARTTILSESLEIEGATHTEHEMPGGARPVRLHAGAGTVTVRYEATVALRSPPTPATQSPLPDFGALALPLHTWTLPSRYCPSDLLSATAEDVAGDHPMNGGVLDVVRAWVEDHIAYVPGTSDVHTSAEETFLRRTGVCRDLAHLTISLLRALDVPARMVAAYALDLEPPDFHAVVEAHDGTAWRLLDPTGLAPVDTLVRIATGRDATDIAWATSAGRLTLDELSVRVARV